METNLTCEEINSLLSAYIDNELSTQDREKVENHLKTCTDCNNKYLEFINIRNLLQLSSQHLSDEINRPFESRKLRPDLSNIDLCREVSDSLSAYLDGELSDEEIYKIAIHLEDCRACRRDLEELKELKKVINEHAQKIGAQYDHTKHLSAGEIAQRVINENKTKSLIYSALTAAIVGSILWAGINFNAVEVIKNAIMHSKAPVIYVRAGE